MFSFSVVRLFLGFSGGLKAHRGSVFGASAVLLATESSRFEVNLDCNHRAISATELASLQYLELLNFFTSVFS